MEHYDLPSVTIRHESLAKNNQPYENIKRKLF